jgi:hypothetical protein
LFIPFLLENVPGKILHISPVLGIVAAGKSFRRALLLFAQLSNPSGFGLCFGIAFGRGADHALLGFGDLAFDAGEGLLTALAAQRVHLGCQPVALGGDLGALSQQARKPLILSPLGSGFRRTLKGRFVAV